MKLPAWSLSGNNFFIPDPGLCAGIRVQELFAPDHIVFLIWTILCAQKQLLSSIILLNLC
jgi:hypothetical protein